MKKKKEKDQTSKVVDGVFTAIQKKYKNQAIVYSNTPVINPKDFYSFGNMTINYKLTGHPKCGVKKGKMYEIYGTEGTFKSTLLYQLYADVQKQGFNVAHLDVERSLQLDVAEKVGVDLSKMLVMDCLHGEQGLEMILEVIENAQAMKIGMIGVDSVDSLIPQNILEGDLNTHEMGAQARLMWAGIRKIVKKLNDPVSLVFINQTKSKIGVVFGSPDYRRGGKAIPFYAWTTIEVKTSRTGVEETKDLAGLKYTNGVWLSLEAKKNKQYPPFRKARVYAEYGYGTNKIADLIEMMLIANVIVAKKVDKKEMFFPNASISQIEGIMSIEKDDKGQMVGISKKQLKTKLKNPAVFSLGMSLIEEHLPSNTATIEDEEDD